MKRIKKLLKKKFFLFFLSLFFGNYQNFDTSSLLLLFLPSKHPTNELILFRQRIKISVKNVSVIEPPPPFPFSSSPVISKVREVETFYSEKIRGADSCGFYRIKIVFFPPFYLKNKK